MRLWHDGIPKNNSGLPLDKSVVIITIKNRYMKKNTGIMRIILSILFVLIMSQNLFASNNTNTDSGLSTVQILGAVALVIAAIIVPSVRGSRKEISHK